MNQPNTKKDKNAIAAAFEQLLKQYQQSESKIATKEEEAEKNRNRQLLNKTVDYTVDNIINGMASLQLNFGSQVNILAQNLTTESNKLAELKKAIAVEQERLQQLNQVRIVVDALHILEQKHREAMASLQAETQQETEAIEKEILQTKKEWLKEQEQFEIRVQEAAILLTKQRESEQSDYQYELSRQRTIEHDEFEENKRLELRDLEETEAINNQDWTKREKYLAEHKPDFIKNQEKIVGFEAKLTEEQNKARVNAIKEADSKYKVEAELKEKEWTANKQGYELKIASLTTVIERQNQQAAEIATQLQEANTQAQNLAMQAFQ